MAKKPHYQMPKPWQRILVSGTTLHKSEQEGGLSKGSSSEESGYLTRLRGTWQSSNQVGKNTCQEPAQSTNLTSEGGMKVTVGCKGIGSDVEISIGADGYALPVSDALIFGRAIIEAAELSQGEQNQFIHTQEI